MVSPITHSWNWRRVRRAGAIALVTALACTTVRAQAGDERGAVVGAEIALRALAYLGVPYRFGGDDPGRGFDCSGLVRFVFRDAFGIELPRRSDEIGRAGSAIERERLQPGDLVFFNTLGRAFSHVGIYIGDGRFVHAPARRGQVRVNALDERYWSARFNGARRLAPAAESAASTRAVQVRDVDDPLWRGH
jgi:cell wall-associated NlpC family hydrolase